MKDSKQEMTNQSATPEPVAHVGGRRAMLRTMAAGAVAVTTLAQAAFESASASAATTPAPTMKADAPVRAFKLYTGSDKASHVLKGTINQHERTDVDAIHFKESPAHAAFEWHNDPEPQYVISLTGTMEFTTRDGETFVMRPGDVLVAEDNIGSGHKWRMIDDQPWRRAYIVLKPGAKDSFVADDAV